MKTFRCVFLTEDEPKTISVVADDARTAASRAAAQFPAHFNGRGFQRVDVEDERGLAYMWQPRAAARPHAAA